MVCPPWLTKWMGHAGADPGGPRGPCPPPQFPPNNLRQHNSQARIQGGQGGLAPLQHPGSAYGHVPPVPHQIAPMVTGPTFEDLGGDVPPRPPWIRAWGGGQFKMLFSGKCCERFLIFSRNSAMRGGLGLHDIYTTQLFCSEKWGTLSPPLLKVGDMDPLLPLF